jgi:hypothetical protein
MSGTLTDRRGYIILTAFWVIAVIAIDPRGNFPLDDDWSYARAVETLLTTHRIQLTDFTSMPLLPQLLWGALFCLPAGFSFTALRLSTLLLGWWGTLGVFVLVRDSGGSARAALLAALVVAACPIYLGLALTFMTDVPFTAMAVWGVVFVCRFLRGHTLRDYVIACLWLLCATMTRQLGLTIAIAAGTTIAVFGERRTRGLAFALPFLCGLALVLYPLLIEHVPLLYSLQLENLRSDLNEGLFASLGRAVRRCGQVFLYVGTFLAPVAIASWRELPRNVRRVALVVPAVASAGVLALGIRMPVSGNVLNDLTVLPVIIAGEWNRPHAPVAIWSLVTIVGLFSGCVLAACVVVNGRDNGRRSADQSEAAVLGFLTLSGLLYVAPFVISRLYDRYLLMVFVLVIAVLATVAVRTTVEVTRRAPAWTAATGVMLLSLFSVATIHDTFSFNRARWAAVDAALQAGVAPDRIDGGFEVNGWLSYDPNRLSTDVVSWWAPKRDPLVLISLAPIDSYVTDRTFVFERWLPWRRAVILSLRPQ